jgi:hypothetical protein
MLRATRLAHPVGDFLHIHEEHNAWQDWGIRIEAIAPKGGAVGITGIDKASRGSW